MNEEQIYDTLNAIHEEAARLLNLQSPQRETEIDNGLQLIISLARYKFDVRSEEEINKAKSYAK